MSWRHINPKWIRDKSYIILKRETKPLHFVEIANKITEAGFDKKWILTQAVHNELLEMNDICIGGARFIRLKEWGYKRNRFGVIEDLLRKRAL